MVAATLVRVMLSKAARRDLLMMSTADRIEAQWRMTDPYDGHQVAEFARAAGEISASAQDAIVSLATGAQLAYLGELGIDVESFFPDVAHEVRLFSQISSGFAEPVTVSTGGVESVRISTAEPFNRPARSFRRAVASGTDTLDALEQSVTRVRMISETNIALAEREAEHQILKEAHRQKPKIIGWRRVLHPEESVGGSCGLCIVASDRLYTLRELKPIHAHCKCETLAVTEDNDPGDELNQADLDRLYADADGNTRDDLKRTRYKVDDHGELQAMLVPQRRGATVPRSRPAPEPLSSPDRMVEAAQRHLPQLRKILAQTLASGKDESSAPVQWQRAQIARFTEILNQPARS